MRCWARLVLAGATPNALLGQVGISGGHTKMRCLTRLVLAGATPNALLDQVGISGGHTKCFAGPGWY